MRYVLVILLCVSILATASLAAACSCVEPLSVPDALEFADSVYSGRVMEVIELDEAEGGYTHAYEMQLFASWKGAAEDYLTLKTTDPAMCGVSFIAGASYLVYADRSGDVLDANNCSRTRALKDADDDIDELGKPTVVPVQQLNFGGVKSNY